MDDQQILDLYFARDQQAIAETDEATCISCGTCAGVCPVGAISE